MSETKALNQGQAESTEVATERPLSLLAAEKFGSQYHGEIPEKSAQPEDQEGPREAEEPEQDDPPEQPDPEEQPEAVTISTLQELIETNEYDPEWVQSLKIAVKVNGSEDARPLSELVKSYQIHQATEAELAETKTKSKAVIEELNQQKTAIAESLQILQTIVQDEAAAINEAEKALNASSLEEDDPAKWSAENIKLEKRRAALEAKKLMAIEAYKKVDESTRQQRDEQLRQYVQNERTMLKEKCPELLDHDTGEAERNKLSGYLIGQGYTKEEIAQAYDHRLVVGLHKAMLWDEFQAKSDVARKKVTKVPKVLKPGAPKSNDQSNREKLSKLQAKAAQSGTVDDAFALLKASRGN